jgi:hypothetical protein
VLCAVQAATVLLPRREHARGRGGVQFRWVGVAAPAAALGTGILVLRVFAGGPHALALLAAAIAPEWSLVAGLVVLAVVDVVLVWGTAQVQPATTALHGATVGHGIPELQDATFGGATMGWLDLVAPGLLGVVAHARLRAAVVTGLSAGAWALLLLVTPTVPATVPVLAALLAGGRGR